MVWQQENSLNRYNYQWFQELFGEYTNGTHLIRLWSTGRTIGGSDDMKKGGSRLASEEVRNLWSNGTSIRNPAGLRLRT
jgi:hypothetical protein